MLRSAQKVLKGDHYASLFLKCKILPISNIQILRNQNRFKDTFVQFLGSSAFPTTASNLLTWAFHIHEIGIGALHQALLLVFPLLLFWRGMKEILCELREAEMQRLRNQRRTRDDRKQPPLPHTGESSPLAAPGVCAAGPPSYRLSAPVYAGGPTGLCKLRKAGEGPLRSEISVRRARGQKGEISAETCTKELTGMFSWGGRHRRKGAKAEILLLKSAVPQEVTPGPSAAMLGRSFSHGVWAAGRGGGCHFWKVSK